MVRQRCVGDAYHSGVFIFITGLVGKEEAKQSKTWPVAIATLERCYLKHHTSNKSVRYYAPAIQCRFSVGGNVYTGTEYDFSADYTTRAKAQAKLDEISALKQLMIRYKPSDPFTNVYKPGMHAVHFIRQLIGFTAVLISSLSMLGIIRY
ncbi:hypothetical protein M0C34_05590 [Agarivorans sp. TSD2052]|uniref:DUF3592 domain-containing protein n=1 Tax=Agarivorans sp. TSD2052 TaxID=2937286 RepID=UPI00200D011A|nr:hypothetical protein [Agarivorans sp. TSD2052]UPW19755.1 hypothetical protein M0C34_05590 [Agarivorans sp. TSD2052]